MEKPFANYLFWIASQVNAANDRGEILSFADVKSAAMTGRIIEFIYEKTNCDLSLLSNEGHATQRPLINKIIQEIATGQDGRERKKMGVENTGCALIIAYMIEGLARGSDVNFSDYIK